MLTLSAKEIMQIIPHRYPFMLLDSVYELVPGESAKGKKNVTFNEQFFQGHFPSEPVMPGVLIIEALAQLGAVIALSCEEFKGKTVYFGGMDKVRFRQKVVPGDTLDLDCRITKFKKPVGVGEARATVNGKLAASAQITFMIG